MRALFILFLSTLYLSAEIPADVSFVVIDLKYNSNDGVKICEMQQGLGCAFEGVDFIEGKPCAFGEIFADFLTPYFQNKWYVRHGIYRDFRLTFEKRADWSIIPSFEKVLSYAETENFAQMNVNDSSKLSDYYGLVVSHHKRIKDKVLKKIKGLIVLNRAFIPSFGDTPINDKLTVSNLLMIDETLSKIKPHWNVYPKGHSQQLINQITQDFSSDLIVIKPRAGLQGRGVIILHKSDLAKTLRYIFSKSPNLKNDPDKAYNWWAKDKHENFIIEEFIESDPVYAPHLSDDLYDGTMRVPVMLTYNEGSIDIHTLYMWWKLPPKSLNEEGSLNEKHKSFSRAPNSYVLVEPEVMEKVENQLKEALPILYQYLLDSGM